MTRTMFMLFAVAYYVIVLAIVAIVLFVMNRKNNQKIENEINDIEREKNLIISAELLSEFSKVESLINNDELRKEYDKWKEKFDYIQNTDLPKITDEINELQKLFEEKEYSSIKSEIIKTEMDLNYIKTKAEFLLNDIKEITLSEERNREKITRLKSEYRQILTSYKENIDDYEIVKKPLELQFENTDKLFSSFEEAMDKNAYTEVGKIVKAIDGIVSNLKVVVEETRIIVQYGKNLIPKKIIDIKNVSKAMESEGYNLNYLNIDYNIEEAYKKVTDIFQRLNVLDVSDSVFELKTMLDYFDSLYSDFDKEKTSKRVFDEYSRSIIIKANKLEKINNKLLDKIDELKYSYDLTDEEIEVVFEIKDEIIDILSSYDRCINSFRNRVLAYSKLSREMEIINTSLANTEERLNLTLKSFASLKEDEARAHEQFEEINILLTKTKEKEKSFKLPVVPENYFVELSEASDAILIMSEELDKRPISIKTLNLRVDTARDLVLKVYNSINEITKTAKMAEMAIVYGNRYRTINKDVDLGLLKAENSFLKGNYKSSLEYAINAINYVEPGIYDKLLNELKN